MLIQAGQVSLGIGSDQAGSVRAPASWTGVVGMKPTFGLVPYTGAMSMEASLDHLGPMAANVKDCALLLEVIAGYDKDGNDGRQQNSIEIPEYSKLLSAKEPSEFKIAVLSEGFDLCDQNVQDVVYKAIDELKQVGACVDHVSIPLHTEGYSTIWLPIGTMGIYLTLLQNAGASTGLKGKQNTSSIGHLTSSISSGLGATSTAIKFSYLLGKYMVDTYGLGLYVKAQNMGRELCSAYNNLLNNYDALVMPTLPFTALKLPNVDKLSPGEYMQQATDNQVNTAPFNVTGHPAISVNAGFSDGLPVGMQIVGKHFDETIVFQIAHAIECYQ